MNEIFHRTSIRKYPQIASAGVQLALAICGGNTYRFTNGQAVKPVKQGKLERYFGKLEVIYFSSSLRPSSLHITCYP